MSLAKLTIAFALTLSSIVSNSFAATTNTAKAAPVEEVRGEIKASFRKDFQDAQLISTDVRKSYTKLTFKMNNSVMFAFYSENGQLLAVTRNILSNQLPIGLQVEVKNKYEGYWISELFEISGQEQNCYYMTLENGDSKIVLRSVGSENWEVFQKTEKN